MGSRELNRPARTPAAHLSTTSGKSPVMVHPSYLLRLPDADAKAREYQRFVDDLKIAAALMRKSAHAA
jgi:uracil-DNA glycosylase